MIFAKIAAVLAILIGSLVVLQEQHVFEKLGVTGGCEVVRAPIADKPDAQWWSCWEGLLTGYPTLVKNNCELRYVPKSRQVWRCPNAIQRPGSLI